MTFVSCGWYLYTLFCYIHKNNFNLTPLLLLVGLIIYTSTDPTVSKTLKNFDIFLKNNTIGVLKVSMNTEDHITYYHSSGGLETQNSSCLDWLNYLHKYPNTQKSYLIPLFPCRGVPMLGLGQKKKAPTVKR